MGYTPEASAILGVRITPGALMFEERVYKVGDHDRPESELFCPKNGRRQWESYHAWRAFGDENGDDADDADDADEGGIGVYSPFCRPWSDAHGPCFVVVGKRVAHQRGDEISGPLRMMPLPPIQAVWDELRAGLQPLGLWGHLQQEFGIWAVETGG